MFSNMKLSTKMVCGFGILIALIGVLGIISWQGMGTVTTTAMLNEAGTRCMDALDTCASRRLEFAARGFEKADGESKNPAEKWYEAFDVFSAELKELGNNSTLNDADRGVLRAASADSDRYKVAFDKQAAARGTKDEAFVAWGRIGREVTQGINEAQTTVIAPALQKAREASDVQQITVWSQIDSRLNRQFVEPFLLLRVKGVNLIATNTDASWKGFEEQLSTVRVGLNAWEKNVSDNEALKRISSQFQGYIDDYADAGKEYHSGIVQDRAASVEMATAAKGISGNVHALLNSLSEQMASATDRTNVIMLSGAGIAIVLGVVLAFFITRSIVMPIHAIINGLNEGADQVQDASGQVAMASQQLAAGASEQASSLEETSSALEEMSAMTRTNAKNAKEADELSEQARQAADTGDHTMGELNDAMMGINESSEKISRIIKVIEEIAFQTNLLALNAAVEAARAGEHGKGFAVVADEVRNLAQRCAQAAGETTTLIEDAVERSQQGTSVAQEVAKALGTIVTDVSKVTGLINGISQASEEQAQGVDQVNTAVAQMDRVTQQNASNAEESASASEELAAQSQAVRAMVSDLRHLIDGKDADHDSRLSGRHTSATNVKSEQAQATTAGNA